MKTFTKFLTMLAVAALFATGCVNEEPPYKEDPNPEPAGMTGYLSIGNLSMTVVYDETEIRPDDTSDETQAARTASGTRATARLPTWTALSWRSSTPTTRRYSK